MGVYVADEATQAKKLAAAGAAAGSAVGNGCDPREVLTNVLAEMGTALGMTARQVFAQFADGLDLAEPVGRPALALVPPAQPAHPRMSALEALERAA